MFRMSSRWLDCCIKNPHLSVIACSSSRVSRECCEGNVTQPIKIWTRLNLGAVDYYELRHIPHHTTRTFCTNALDVGIWISSIGTRSTYCSNHTFFSLCILLEQTRSIVDREFCIAHYWLKHQLSKKDLRSKVHVSIETHGYTFDPVAFEYCEVDSKYLQSTNLYQIGS